MREHQRAEKRANPAWAWRALVALASTTLAAAPIASRADVEIIGPTVVEASSYTGDSSHGVTDFENAIAGQTLTLIPFTHTSAGELIVLDGQEERTALSDTFSEEALFRSPNFTPESYPNQEDAHPDQVNLINAGSSPYDPESGEPDIYQINPLPTPSDTLEIDFIIDEEDTGVLAVGLGLYATFGRTVTIFDADDEEVTNYAHSGDEGFVFIGFVATTPEDAIGRVEITGDESIVVVDVSFVPEPATGIASAVALFAVFGLARAHRRRS